MAIEYRIDIATPWSADMVVREVLDHGQRAGILNELDTTGGLLSGVLAASGSQMAVMQRRAPNSKDSWDPVHETFGFWPTVSIFFRYSKFDDFVRQGDDMVRVTVNVLERVPGDLILLMPESDLVWLLRRSGDLTLNESNALWTPDRLAMVSQPCRRATVTFGD